MQKNKKLLILTMLLISMFQMGMVAMSPIVASITTAFPGTSQTTAQLAMTFLCLIIVVAALSSGTVARLIGRRAMCVIGMVLCTLAAVCGAFATKALWMVFLWSAFLGASIGLFTPAVSSMMIDFLDDDERTTVAGVQTTFVNVGGMALSFFAGVLAGSYWCNAYLVFLISAPIIFMAWKFIPPEPKKPAVETGTGKRSKIPAAVWLATLQTFIFSILYFAFSTNISLLLVERGIGSTALAGTATSVFMMGGAGFGILFTKAIGIFGKKLPAIAFLLVGISYVIICATGGVAPLMIASFIGGGSLSLIFPCFLVTIANKVDPSISVISSSLILSAAPNLGSFVSPIILTTLSNVIFGTVAGRLELAAIVCFFMGVLLLLLNIFKKS